MRLKKLLRKDIEPRCTYCAHGSPLADGKRIACRKRGVRTPPTTAARSVTTAAPRPGEACRAARKLHERRFFSGG